MSVEHVNVGEDVALVDLIDRLIGGGVVLTGDIVLSIADVDLVYVGLRLVLAPAHVVEDWMYERVTAAYVGDEDVRKFFSESNPWALRAIAERLLEAEARGLWRASRGALATLRGAVLEAEGWEESR